jgi:phage terminase large subunit GpA-like protein
MKNILNSAYFRGLKPQSRMMLPEWSDKNRILSSKSSESPGPWRTDKTPYLRKIMECLSTSSPIEQIVFMKSSQIGATEIGNNFLGYVIHHAPGPLLYVMPTIEAAKKTSKQRIAPMIEDSPVLKYLVQEPRSRDSGNTILTKDFPGGIIMLTGANSAVGLRSMPVRYLFLDEVDGYPVDVDSEGDPVMLAIKRTQTFNNTRKIFLVSTPTLKGFSRIEKAYLETDQQKYHVPCPHCNTLQTLDWSKIVWENNDPSTAALKCESCKISIPHSKKTWMLENGEWKSTSESKSAKTVGFHLNALYSPWQSWEKTVEEYLAAKDDPALLKSWTNTTLGETWDEPGTQVDSNMLYYRREEYKAEVPNEAIVITAGIDVQGDRLEAEAVGWNEQKESWSIDYQVFFGDPDQPDVWNQLEEWLKREWKHETGHRLKIECACIDSGGHHTQQVYAFCKPRTRRRVFAIKGVGGMGRAIASSPSHKRSGREKRPVPLFTIGVDTAKEVLYSRLLKTEQGAGYCHFPNHEPPYTEQYFEQLTAEKLISKTVNGIPKPVWQLTSGKRNEALDCRVYAMAGLELLRPNFEKHREYLETEALTDHQREYEINRKKVIQRMNPKKRVVTSPWMADVLGGPGSFDY